MTKHEQAGELKSLLEELETIEVAPADADSDAPSGAVLEAINRRARLVERIVALDRALAGVDGREIALALAECESVLQRIVARDEQLHKRLVRRKDAVGARIASIGRGRSALAAYANRTREPKTRFQDTRV